MLTGTSIVCFAHDWDGDPTSKTHIMRILAEDNRVLWIDSIGMRRPTASGRDVRRMASKLRRTFDGCREVRKNLWVLSPLTVPLPGVPAADRINARLLATWIRRHLRRLDMREPILWTYVPNVTRLVGALGERTLVYHCVDEYSAFAGVPREALIRAERELVGRADVVLTSSEALCEERRRLNPRTWFVPHGVDVDHFSRALDPDTVPPPQVAGVRRPIVGFFGLIAEWIDLELVATVARSRPDWSFVLVGSATRSLAPLTGLPNVHLPGRRPYAELPRWCRAFDVAIVPFTKSELTEKANPLKVREYLAAGLPVVSSPMPEVARYGNLLELADGPEEFRAAIEAALASDSDGQRRRRVEAMRRESWQRRVEDISEIVSDRVRLAS